MVVCIRIESVTITLAEAQELIKEKIPDLTITTTVVHVGNRSVIEVRCAEKEVSITKLQGRVREVMKDYQITVWNYVAGRPRLNPRR